MAKVSFTKLQLKKNTNVIELPWNDQVIEIKEYLPIESKLQVIERIVNQSLDDNNFANPGRIEINTVLEMMFAYTNINFTDKQKEDRLALYDLLVSSGLWNAVAGTLASTGEATVINDTTQAVIDEVYRYKTSALGILQAVSEDYSNLDLDAANIEKKISNRENVEFLADVMKKMG